MKKSVLFVLMLCFTSVCWGWNCTGGDIRVQVPSTTKAPQGDAPGDIVTVQGLTFQCQAPPSTTSPTTTNSNTNNNTNSNSNSNKNTNVNNVSNTLSNTLSNTQKQQQSQNQNQSQTATGGNASSTSSATGGTSSAKSLATNNGNGSNNNTTNVAAPTIPVATAYAPTALPSAPCIKSYSGAAQSVAFGMSLGGGKIDEGCDERELARSFALLGSRISACKILIQGKQAKKAGITLEDCMGPAPQPVAVMETPAPVIPIIVAPLVMPEVKPALPILYTSIDVHPPKKRVVHKAIAVSKPCPIIAPNTVKMYDSRGNVIAEK